MLVTGASGHSIELLDLLEISEISNIVFYDNVNNNNNYLLDKYPILHSMNEAIEHFRIDNRYFLGVGSPKLRFRFAKMFMKVGGVHCGIISNSSIISKRITSIHNTVDLFHNTFVSSKVVIERGTLINTGAQIHHDVSIGQFCEISPGVKILGKVKIGNFCSIGAGAIILPKLEICDRVVIGGGSVVTKNITHSGTYIGIPSKLMIKHY